MRPRVGRLGKKENTVLVLSWDPPLAESARFRTDVSLL